MYKIPSSSMEPTLIPGDYILVNKMYYGARLLKFRKFYKENKIEYLRTRGWSRIRCGDVFVFNWPNYGSLWSKSPNMFGDFIVKRCFGVPGDTIKIINKDAERNAYIGSENKSDIFPHDTTLNWKVDSFGPLFVPGIGKTISLTHKNATIYKEVLMYEGFQEMERNDSVFLNGQYTSTFTFKHNYYFMKGDNFYGSQDSRYWGFVPEENIVGKVIRVLFSNGEDGWMWDRVMKGIK